MPHQLHRQQFHKHIFVLKDAILNSMATLVAKVHCFDKNDVLIMAATDAVCHEDDVGDVRRFSLELQGDNDRANRKAQRSPVTTDNLTPTARPAMR